jgi:hypothetical protein
MTKQIKEDGGLGGGGMTAGTGGFSSSASAKGPVSGYDPIMGMKKRVKDKIKRAKPPQQPGVMISDNN